MIAKRIVLAVLVLTGLTLGSLPALATTTNISLPSGSALGSGVVHDFGDYVDLGMTNESLKFTGTGSSNSVSLDLGACSGGTCTLTGLANGYGTFGNPAHATFQITSPANINLMLTDPTLNIWTAQTNANAIHFQYGPGGSLLTGYMNLLQFQEVSPLVSHGNDWYLGTSQVTITGGSLDRTGGMSAQYLFVNSPAYFNTLLAPSSRGGTISTRWGEGPIFPTPEPASLLLLGSGFLVAGGVVRTRLRQKLWRA